MKVKVDSTKCLAYGDCAAHAPEIFKLDDFGYAQTEGDGEVPPGLEEKAEQALKACPAQAIYKVE
jgi:ferredoxin